MSENIEGAIFRAKESQVLDYFCHLNPGTWVRLIQLTDDPLWGIYSEGWPGDREVLELIAQSASRAFHISLLYGYYSAVGFCCGLYENGTQVRSLDPDAQHESWTPENLFEPLGYDRKCQLHDRVEQAFNWRHEDWVLEHRPA